MARNVVYLDEIVEECWLLPTVNSTPKQCHYGLELELGCHLKADQSVLVISRNRNNQMCARLVLNTMDADRYWFITANIKGAV